MLRGTVALTLLAAAIASGQEPKAAPYRVARKLAVGGEGPWDLLAIDPRTQRLFVPRSDYVMVIDVERGTVVGKVEGTPGVAGVALAPEVERGFTSNSSDGSMSVFDLKTLEVLGKVKAGTDPDAIVHEPVTRRIFCFNGWTNDVAIVDAAVDLSKPAAAGRLELKGRPELAVADGKGQVFVNLADTGEVVRIDARTTKVTARWPVAPGESPVGLGIDVERGRLFSTCENGKMVVLDAETGNVLATLPIGEMTDGAAFDAETKTAISSSGDGTFTAVRETSGRFEVIQKLETQWGARTMAFDPTTHRVYLPTATFKEERGPGGEEPFVPGSFVILVVER